MTQPTLSSDYYNIPNTIYIPLSTPLATEHTLYTTTNTNISSAKHTSLLSVAALVHRRELTSTDAIQSERKIYVKQKFRRLTFSALHQFRLLQDKQCAIIHTNQPYRLDMATIVMHANIYFRASLLKLNIPRNNNPASNLAWLHQIPANHAQHNKSLSTKHILNAKRLFDMLDGDQSHTIDASEIKSAYDRLGIDISMSDIQYRLSCIDHNGNNVVDWHEFVNGFDEQADWKSLYILAQSSPQRIQLPFSIVIPAAYRKQYIDDLFNKYSISNTQHTLNDGHSILICHKQQLPQQFVDDKPVISKNNKHSKTAKHELANSRLNPNGGDRSDDNKSSAGANKARYIKSAYWGSKQVLLSTINCAQDSDDKQSNNKISDITNYTLRNTSSFPPSYSLSTDSPTHHITTARADGNLMRDNDDLIRICRMGQWYKILINMQNQQFKSPHQSSQYINRRDRNGSNVLHHSVWYNNIQCVKVLLANTMIDVNTKNNRMNTALHLACERHYIDIIDVLLQHNALIDMINVDKKTCVDMIYLNTNKSHTESTELEKRVRDRYAKQRAQSHDNTVPQCNKSFKCTDPLSIASVVDEGYDDNMAMKLNVNFNKNRCVAKHSVKPKLQSKLLLSLDRTPLSHTLIASGEHQLHSSTMALSDVAVLEAKQNQSTNSRINKQTLNNIRLQLVNHTLNELFHSTLHNISQHHQ